MGVSTSLLLPWSFIRLNLANAGLLCSEVGAAQRGGWGRGLAFGCAVCLRRFWRRWRTLGAVSNFRWIGVFSFTAAGVGAPAGAAVIIGTSTGLDTAGAPALFPP